MREVNLIKPCNLSVMMKRYLMKLLLISVLMLIVVACTPVVPQEQNGSNEVPLPVENRVGEQEHLSSQSNATEPSVVEIGETGSADTTSSVSVEERIPIDEEALRMVNGTSMNSIHAPGTRAEKIINRWLTDQNRADRNKTAIAPPETSPVDIQAAPGIENVPGKRMYEGLDNRQLGHVTRLDPISTGAYFTGKVASFKTGVIRPFTSSIPFPVSSRVYFSISSAGRAINLAWEVPPVRTQSTERIS